MVSILNIIILPYQLLRKLSLSIRNFGKIDHLVLFNCWYWRLNYNYWTIRLTNIVMCLVWRNMNNILTFQMIIASIMFNGSWFSNIAFTDVVTAPVVLLHLLSIFIEHFASLTWLIVNIWLICSDFN